MTAGDGSLSVSEVALARGGRQLVEGLNFTVEPGQLALVTGPNGCGKTTLLRTIAGLAVPESGTIVYGGRSIFEFEPEERGQLAYQGHYEGLKKDLSIEENLHFIKSLYGNSEPVSTFLSGAGLTPFRRRALRHLSAGQKRRASLAALRLRGARLWLLDEPLTNLDQAGRELVADWVNEHLDAGGSAVVATHLAGGLQRPGSVVVEF